ncbi:hypothetical protein HBN50_07005 [Halobacteriovorax sp. GB3]|uniref:hypothetical protein n=1 Tax=Halobacteriovorax sp. GB3 TaxID=2719615 RepID=UPI0023624B41|nr:hypothetical protein [Halobacteriovorax sp. GB3]MDD0852836.1 hypothetical protein [Halobacteriovorax sp. GB3]
MKNKGLETKIMTIFSALVMTTFSASSFSKEITLKDGEKILRIEVGKDKYQSNKEMIKRIHQLERAVWHLQNRVYELESGIEVKTALVDTKIYHCTLSTSFNGVFSGNGESELEAKSEVLKRCVSKVGKSTIWCDRDEVKCDSSIQKIRK